MMKIKVRHGIMVTHSDAWLVGWMVGGFVG